MVSIGVVTGFKLLAIRPLPECNRKYSKSLELGRDCQVYKWETKYDKTAEKEMELVLMKRVFRFCLTKSKSFEVYKQRNN